MNQNLIFLFFLITALNLSSRLEAKTLLLTNQEATVNNLPRPPFPGSQFGDPASPRIERDGSVLIYGTGNFALKYKPSGLNSGLQQLLEGAKAEISRIRLAYSNGVLINEEGLDETPWDLSVETFDDKEFLYAGIMIPSFGKKHAHFPEDNWSRRVFAFENQNGLWVQRPMPLTYPKTHNLVGHSYGHHFIEDEQKQIWIFYERVLEKKVGQTFEVTGIFARKMFSAYETNKDEYEVLNPSSLSYPAIVRGNGDRLIEGARPFKVVVGGRTVYVLLFSGGDFATDHYGLNMAYATAVTGPYRLSLNAKGTDLQDYGTNLKKVLCLGWGPGRGALFNVNGKWKILFAAVRKDLWPQYNFDVWPENFESMPIFRDLFLADVTFSFVQGELTMKID